MDSVFLYIIFFLIVIIIYLFIKLQKENPNWSISLIQEQILNINKNLEEKLLKTSETVDKKLFETNNIINNNILKTFETSSKIALESNNKIEEITKKLTSLEETNKQIKDIWWQLDGLEKILKNPKQRGLLGEYFLENILKNILPPDNYSLQYVFKDWTIVDWIIFVDNKKIPIDSKFSLENYNKIVSSAWKDESKIHERNFYLDLKNRIEETSKYIKVDEWTMEFAFMFIPSEGIYYDLLINKFWWWKDSSRDLIEYAFREKKVIIVSPTSFYAYLQTVMQWLRALKIEETAKDIKNNVIRLQWHLKFYEEYIKKLWTSLWTTVNHFNNASKEFLKIEKDVLKISQEEKLLDSNILLLEKPDLDK